MTYARRKAPPQWETEPSIATYVAIHNAKFFAPDIPDSPVKPGEKGDSTITEFVISLEGANRINLSMSMNGHSRRAVAPGTYRKLMTGGLLQMTDTPAEKADHMEVVQAARGHCLITGLGIGMVANAMAIKPEVESVTVIELNQNVIDLVMPYMSAKITAVQGDAHTCPLPDRKWDVIWHDIWPSISLDDCESRNKLSRRFSRRWGHYHGAWAKNEIRRLQREDHRW